MGSSDKSWRIERYPDLREAKDGKNNIVAGYSYGCPELGLMGYLNVFKLLIDMAQKMGRKERMKRTDFIYCVDCKTYVDLWKYGDVESSGHGGCNWRFVNAEELEECIRECDETGCFEEEIQ